MKELIIISLLIFPALIKVVPIIIEEMFREHTEEEDEEEFFNQK
jgi:hypothetical protein